MKLPIYLSLFIVTLSTPHLAQANNSCDTLIEHGINNITTERSADHAMAYKWHSSCGLDFQSASNQDIHKASVTVFGKWGGSGSSNMNSDRKKLQTWCNENQEFAENRADLFTEAQVVSKPALDAFTSCIEMARKNILISFTASSEHSETVAISVDSTHDGTLKFYGVDTKNYDCKVSMEINGQEVDPNSQPSIRNSNIHMVCSRNKPITVEKEGVGTLLYDSAFISVNTSGPSLPLMFNKVVDTYVVTPPKSVIAFNNVECPPGWELFQQAEHRFILGAGKKEKLGSLGGSEFHTHSVEEMPKHSHGYRNSMVASSNHEGKPEFERYSGLKGTEFKGDASPTLYHVSSETKEIGAGKPHKSLPPYLALTYCQKL
ncbi:hypothetical protein MTR11_21900 [Vibrio sp. CCB-PB317]|uniref:hypothetical protein n=1 Tax=Vibrio sp. CCB-PB317 TaxID=2929171 RepID=UPI001FAE2857|nr:hypothetical protein [Vibrio sp. CCB-PB317]MCJ0884338.1 hypothetical protein [Vibrio sp. CCB-PB317]